MQNTGREGTGGREGYPTVFQPGEITPRNAIHPLLMWSATALLGRRYYFCPMDGINGGVECLALEYMDKQESWVSNPDI